MSASFFTDFNVPKDAKIAIDGLERVTPKAKHSHNSAWVQLYRNMLVNAGWKNVEILGQRDTYEGYDVLIISLGIAYGGAINYFFGIDDNVVWRFKRIQDFKGQTFVMNHDMPMIGASVKSRWTNKSTSKDVVQLDPERLDEICRNTRRFDHVERTRNLCFGDSHSFSTYHPGQMVCRNDGLTLFSTLRDGLGKKIEERSGIKLSDLDSITIYLGNIDVRHHLMRTPDGLAEIQRLAAELQQQIKDLGIKNVELVNLLPIENESRKLPGTGLFKGTAFYGSWAERTKLVETFNAAQDKMGSENGWRIFHWPAKFINSNGELDFEYMERPKSIHLSPQSYRWNLETDKFNSLHNGVNNVR